MLSAYDIHRGTNYVGFPSQPVPYYFQDLKANNMFGTGLVKIYTF